MSVFTGKSVLITGASAGLGEQFALHLADLGANPLFLTARRTDRLEELKARLRQAHPSLKVEVVPADLSDTASTTGLMTELEKRAFFPDILINNAGLGDLGTFETSDPAKIEAMLAVNIVSLTRLTRWAAPAMLARKTGWICNVGSTAGMLPLPTFAVYAATKAYVNSFSEALRVELHGSGVMVQALCPGPVETEFGDVASRTNSKRKFAAPHFIAVDKAEVVRQTLDALARGQGRIIPGLTVRFPMLFIETFPRWILRPLMNLFTGDFRREREQAKSA